MKTTYHTLLTALCLAASVHAARAFTIDCDIPAGNVIVDSIEGDVAKVRQDLRDTKDGWFHWAFRVKAPRGRP